MLFHIFQIYAAHISRSKKLLTLVIQISTLLDPHYTREVFENEGRSFKQRTTFQTFRYYIDFFLKKILELYIILI